MAILSATYSFFYCWTDKIIHTYSDKTSWSIFEKWPLIHHYFCFRYVQKIGINFRFFMNKNVAFMKLCIMEPMEPNTSPQPGVGITQNIKEVRGQLRVFWYFQQFLCEILWFKDDAAFHKLSLSREFIPYKTLKNRCNN